MEGAGVGGAVQGIDGESHGRVVAETRTAWLLDTGGTAAKLAEGREWRWVLPPSPEKTMDEWMLSAKHAEMWEISLMVMVTPKVFLLGMDLEKCFSALEMRPTPWNRNERDVLPMPALPDFA